MGGVVDMSVGVAHVAVLCDCVCDVMALWWMLWCGVVGVLLLR